jgi:hypothetical protein
MQRVRWIFAAAVVALGVAACGGDDGAVLPFEEIQASEIVVEADPTNPMRAIFRVDTTEPAICAVVWGETEALGNFNNSLDMNGTGIVEHNVFLPGAEPGRTYYFQLQGSTADGSLYRSDIDTLTVPELTDTGGGEALPEMGPNLAEGATVTEVSSEFSASWTGANAVDGDLLTEWSTAGDGDAAFIEIDLGSIQDVAGFQFLTRSMADGTATATTYQVVVDDGVTLGPFPAGNPAQPGFAAADLAGQVFRFQIISSTGGNTGAVEVRVLAPAG